MSGGMYWHGRPLEDVHSEVDRVLQLTGKENTASTNRPPTCADDSTVQMRQVPLPGTVSVLLPPAPCPH